MSHYYPKIQLNNRNFLLSIYPQYHTNLFPDSKLNNESSSAVVDTTYANSISKIYLSGASDASLLKPNDIILIYRTKDKNTTSPAYYSSVATSICVVTEIKSINDFNNFDNFKTYCNNTSVFTEKELQNFWETKKYQTLIKFDYYFPLTKRINRARIFELSPKLKYLRWTLLQINDELLRAILTESGDKNFILN